MTSGIRTIRRRWSGFSTSASGSLAGIIFAVKLRRGTLIHAESRKQRMEREMAMSTTPLLCAQVQLYTMI